MTEQKVGYLRCEGYRRRGGAFSMGPVTWLQCSEEAVVYVTVLQNGEQGTFPGCIKCWTEAENNPKISVTQVVPIQLKDKTKGEEK